jgi:hypothetical protein
MKISMAEDLSLRGLSAKKEAPVAMPGLSFTMKAR